MKKIWQFIKPHKLFIALILIAVPFRIYHLTYPILDSFNFRQAQTATFALNFYKHGINLFRTELDIFGVGHQKHLTLEFPIYEAIVATLYKLFFVSDVWGRIVSIAAGFIGAWYLYKIVSLLINDKKIAVYSVFFFLFAPLNLFYHRAFMIEPTIIAFLLAGTFYYLKWVNNQDGKSYILALLLLTIGFMHKGLYGPFWLLPMVVYYLNMKSIKQIFSFRYLTVILVPLALLFLWQHHVNNINTYAGHVFFTLNNPGQLEWNFGFLADRLSWSEWSFRLRQVLNGIFLKPGLLFFIIGLFLVQKYDKRNFFLFWMISQFIYFVTLFRIQQQNYYQTIMVPAFSVIMAIGLNYLMDGLHRIILTKFINKSFSSFVSKFSIILLLSILIYKSWINTLPSFFIDWDWYQRLQTVKQVLPGNAYGILVTPGVDWNSVYTYIPDRKMLQTSIENITQENLIKWQNLGYSFLILHEYDKYQDYLVKELKIKDNNYQKLIDHYKEVLDIQEFKVYLLSQ